LTPGSGDTPSVGTTPAAGTTPEPSATQGEPGDAEPPQEQINLTAGGPGEEDEENLHEVRAKALKYVTASSDDDGKKPDSPWATQGIGPLRLLKNKKTGLVRLLLRAQPSGNVALNRVVMSGQDYKATEKYVRLTTSDDTGVGLESWMLQVKTKEAAAALATALEQHKGANKQ
jgi:nucleoporin NUP2